MNNLFDWIIYLEEGIWNWFSIPTILFVGVVLTFRSKAIQFRRIGFVMRTFASLVRNSNGGKGVDPIRAFFASVGGCVGVGNVVAICTAIQVGGPGALFWIWITAFLGMIVKYAEVFLGIRYRVQTASGYSGGPHYYLQKVFKTAFFPLAAAWLLCIYGIEVYQFSVVTKHLSYTFQVSEIYVTLTFLGLILWACLGGVNRVGRLSSWIIPVFVITYIAMSWVVFYQHSEKLIDVIRDVFYYAFTPHSILGGTFGSLLMLTVSHGIRRGCYTGDVGVGYASVIQSETSLLKPEIQASLSFVDIFLDTFVICTTSVMLILVTGVWQNPMEASLLVQTALSTQFPYMPYFISFFLFLLGYSTINAYFVSGLKCAEYLSPRYGKRLFIFIGLSIFALFSMYETTLAQSVMTTVGGMLLLLNGYGIFSLRKEIDFTYLEEKGVMMARSEE